MDTRDTFRAAVLAAPDDDTPRLVFADWLEEQGDPYGEFVRVQVALAALPPPWPLLPELLEARCWKGRREPFVEFPELPPNWLEDLFVEGLCPEHALAGLLTAYPFDLVEPLGELSAVPQTLVRLECHGSGGETARFAKAELVSASPVPRRGLAWV